MTTPPADSDSTDAFSRPPTREAAQCEAGLRRVLAYICARRHRRLITFIAVFLLIYSAVRIPVSLVAPTAFGLLFVSLSSDDSPTSPELLSMMLSLATIIPSLVITLLIFTRLRHIYKNYILPGELVAESDSD